MKVVNTNNNLNFQSQLNISKITSNKKEWQKLAAQFSDYDFSHVFDLASLKNGGIRGQYRDNSFKDLVDFTITPKGVDDLLDKNANLGAIFLKFLETHFIMLKYNVFHYKYLSKTINDCAKFIHTYKCDTIEELNIAIASNNKIFERFNKAYKDKGISLDYPPLGYVRKPITNPSERETRINTIEKRIHKINTEINAKQEDIKELRSKSIFTKLYNKLTGKEDIKKKLLKIKQTKKRN